MALNIGSCDASSYDISNKWSTNHWYFNCNGLNFGILFDNFVQSNQINNGKFENNERKSLFMFYSIR